MSIGKCSNCIHFAPTREWPCALNPRAALLSRGHTLPVLGFPDPSGFGCEDHEPP